MEGLDVTPNFNGIYELTALDLCSRHIRHSRAPQCQSAHQHQQQKSGCGGHGQALAPPERRNLQQNIHDVAFLNRTEPLSTPETTTCSTSLAGPSVTSRLSNPEPFLARTKKWPPSLKMASRGATKTWGAR